MKQRGLLIVVGLILAFLALGYGVHLWRREPPETAPPTIDLRGADPVVAQAIEQARTEVRQQPRSAVAWGRLGTLLAVHDFADPATICFAQAERLDPIEPRWPYFHGITLQKEDPSAALPFLHHAMEQFGNEAAPRLRTAG